MLKIVTWRNKPPLGIWPLGWRPALRFGKVGGGGTDEWITYRSLRMAVIRNLCAGTALSEQTWFYA